MRFRYPHPPKKMDAHKKSWLNGWNLTTSFWTTVKPVGLFKLTNWMGLFPWDLRELNDESPNHVPTNGGSINGGTLSLAGCFMSWKILTKTGWFRATPMLGHLHLWLSLLAAREQVLVSDLLSSFGRHDFSFGISPSPSQTWQRCFHCAHKNAFGAVACNWTGEVCARTHTAAWTWFNSCLLVIFHEITIKSHYIPWSWLVIFRKI